MDDVAVVGDAVEPSGGHFGVAEDAGPLRQGSRLLLETSENAVVLFMSGTPLDEPIAGHGPFVMNTREEIMQAMKDFSSGKFRQMAA